MEYEFFYADIQLGITVKAEPGSVFADLSSEERLAMQQLFYLAANSFSYARCLFLAKQAKIEEELHRLQEERISDGNMEG